MDIYRLNNWMKFGGRAIYRAFESEIEAIRCADRNKAQLYRISKTGGAALIYWPGKHAGHNKAGR